MPPQDEHYTGRMKLSISYAVFCEKKKFGCYSGLTKIRTRRRSRRQYK
ncbi:hypothetical protein [Neisseria meningitidis]|nr:hypothetical protein [Neisseria meningitidis]